MTNDKSEAENIIASINGIFTIATIGFDDFYKQAEQKGSGNSSTAASSGDSSTAASSGDSSKAASSGNSSTAASSGDDSTAASSGYYSKAASSGDSSKAASSGNSSKAASSGDFSKAASSGNSSTAASSGYSSTAASSGDDSTAASSGNYSTAASSGDCSKAASSGYSSTAASSGDCSKAASSGVSSKAASSGDFSKAESSGEHSACTAVGYRAGVKGDKGNLLMASEYIRKDGKYIPVGGKADIVDGKKLKAGCWYIVEGGEWVEIDFSDGIFSRVISNRNGVRKVKTENGSILFVVSDANGNSAHGETIKQAREDLIYKAVAKFDGEIPKKATGKEWVGLYRVITGACSAGIKSFVEGTGKGLDDVYTKEQICELIKGKFGEDKFLSACKKK